MNDLAFYRSVGTLTPTRFPNLYIWHQGPALWRFVGADPDEGTAWETGPQMRSKAEALAHVGQFAADQGWDPSPDRFDVLGAVEEIGRQEDAEASRTAVCTPAEPCYRIADTPRRLCLDHREQFLAWLDTQEDRGDASGPPGRD